MIRLYLWLLCNFVDESLSWVMAVMSIPIVEALSAHILAQMACVCSETSDSNTHVVIDVEDFFLVACQIMWWLLQGHKDLCIKMVKHKLVNEKLSSLCLLYHRKISLTTWELDLRPREVEPCFTASFAYSIYKYNYQYACKFRFFNHIVFVSLTYLQDFSLGIKSNTVQAVIHWKHL